MRKFQVSRVVTALSAVMTVVVASGAAHKF
jgi:hypothetical protein